MSSSAVSAGDSGRAGFDLMQNRIESLSSKMDKLMDIQEKVLNRLDGMSHDIDDIEQDMESLKVDKEEIHVSPKVMNQTQIGREVKEICKEMSTIISVVNQRSEQQAQKLEGMEKLVLSMQQVISFIGETVKRSKVMEMMFKGPAARKGSKLKDNKGRQAVKKKSADAISKKLDKAKGKDGTDLGHKKAQKKLKPPDVADSISLKKQALLLEEVLKLNKENVEKSNLQPVPPDLEAGMPPTDQELDVVPEKLADSVAVAEEEVKETEREEGAAVIGGEPAPHVEEEETSKEEEKLKSTEEAEEGNESAAREAPEVKEVSTHEEHEEEVENVSDSNKESTSKEDQIIETDEEDQRSDSEDWAVFKAEGVELQFSLKAKLEGEKKEQFAENDDEDDGAERFFIDSGPPPSAPFNHRIVSAKPNQIRNFYTINWQEVLGGGRFGQVHKCIENSSGLTLAAKVIKARSQKEKDVVKNEIQVMNNLDHANLIQLYAAYESRNDIILVLEYVGGGELFDRIIDENYTLMELDAIVFIRQICDGLQYMHKMSILHLDLKPENILCVSRATSKIKIIDFGLARIYKPREKLRVNFGTPEFLAPEVINFDFVSFNTDMWSLGVITYMLLSGLCPFLGDNDTETLNNILAAQWNFEEEEFVDTSEEAKDFIRRLLIVNKSWRMGACEALRHPWLSDPVLHHRLHTKKTMCKSRRSSCVPHTES
ncbi:myosin light chain kinase 2, skeletal/cardiac muscle isoform X2 [Oryzias melastigma]|uniref:Myosin light chain kinase family, member 4a n=1 Tax=Oryzias melastigma TaxID=30732 RepID=A0A3B3BFH4_ORYME|nr:myosin light chain kinase 2, skeletal/cardiac muscle isoform X2 [Oryzias melastigma]